MLTLNDGRNELWQWDTGRKLTVDADCSQVHFSNKVFGRSIDVDVVDGTAAIPDVLLQVDNELIAWAFVGTPENGYTKISKVFKVNKRNKPADYVFTPPEQTTLGQIMKRLDRIEESQDPDAIKNAVDDYLANNPIQIDEKDPTVPAWAKQATKPKYTATEVGAVATVNGVKPDANGNVEITVQGSGGNADQSGGLSATASALLIGILKNAVYTADQSANITALEVELAMGGGSGSGGSGGGEASAYTVVCTLGDATIDNNASAVAAGASYTATITPNKGYELDTVTVLMGGVDVTATVYVDGVINIESVTGNVIIKVTTVEASDILYQLSEPTTFDGTNAIDTKVALLDEDKDWSIVVDLSIASPMSYISESYIYRILSTEANNTLLALSCYNNGCRYTLNENGVTIRDMVWVGEKAGNTHKGVITHTAGTTVAVVNCYQTNIKGQVETATDKEIIASSYPQDDNTIMLCPIGGGGAVNVNDFKIYNRVLTDDEITAYLGV